MENNNNSDITPNEFILFVIKLCENLRSKKDPKINESMILFELENIANLKFDKTLEVKEIVYILNVLFNIMYLRYCKEEKDILGFYNFGIDKWVPFFKKYLIQLGCENEFVDMYLSICQTKLGFRNEFKEIIGYGKYTNIIDNFDKLLKYFENKMIKSKENYDKIIKIEKSEIC